MPTDDNACPLEKRCPICRGATHVVRVESGVLGLPPELRRQIVKCSACGLVAPSTRSHSNRNGGAIPAEPIAALPLAKQVSSAWLTDAGCDSVFAVLRGGGTWLAVLRWRRVMSGRRHCGPLRFRAIAVRRGPHRSLFVQHSTPLRRQITGGAYVVHAVTVFHGPRHPAVLLAGRGVPCLRAHWRRGGASRQLCDYQNHRNPAGHHAA
jgi:hypothetical protein